MGRYKRRMDRERILIFGAALILACVIGAIVIFKVAPLFRITGE